jgi:hypothetical protein
VTGDAPTADGPDDAEDLDAVAAAVDERLAVVAGPLAEVDGTGSPAADEHVAAARERLSRALDADDAGDADESG